MGTVLKSNGALMALQIVNTAEEFSSDLHQLSSLHQAQEERLEGSFQKIKTR